MKKILLAAVMLLSSCAAGTTNDIAVTEQTMPAASETVSSAETITTAETISEAKKEPVEIALTSDDLHDGYWDVKISHDKGDDISPAIAWESVPGASCYALYMIDPDGGNWIHMKAVTAEAGLSSGDVAAITAGRNIDRIGAYIGPYPPDGVHTYNVYVFALEDNADWKTLPGGNVDGTLKVSDADRLIAKMKEEHTVLGVGMLSGEYPGEAPDTAAQISGADITEGLVYDEKDNTWSTANEKYIKLAQIMKSECSRSPDIQGTYLLATDNEVIFIGGMNSVDTSGKKVGAYTTYEIGSVTKTITATAVFQLIEQGKLSLDDTLEMYFPGNGYQYSDEITVYHLLHMQSGLNQEFCTRSFKNNMGTQDTEVTEKFYTDGYTDEELLSELFMSLPMYEPGTEQSYSNAGYTLLAMIIEKVTGESYADYVKKNIFDVCGMDNTTSMVSGGLTSIPDEIPEGVHKLNYDGLLDNGYMRFARTARGAMDIHSCAADMLAFDRALAGGRLISEKSLTEMFNTDGEYGCGWLPLPIREDSYYHTGMTPSYITDNVYIRSKEYGNVYLMQFHSTLKDSDYIAGCDISIAGALDE